MGRFSTIVRRTELTCYINQLFTTLLLCINAVREKDRNMSNCLGVKLHAGAIFIIASAMQFFFFTCMKISCAKILVGVSQIDIALTRVNAA
ncbi:hypothetical protein GDO78_010853 [Eleutherodactylus coqui]|uniref:Uncharacterized protein n=1 Tax=Eleutherodactylus coqui TaxID=57060 RepID=A0A8J6F7S9_ELECQ|nr:hypothetical protein GDO78_010853 [Eleutherodactylus coqui]